MTLIGRIEEELKAARLARDEDRRDALSLLLNSLQAAQKELQRPLSDDEELQVLQRERKRRVEAAEAFRAGGREEQAEDEEYEPELLAEFMPEQMSEDDRLALFNDQERVNAMLVKAYADSRIVCDKRGRTGSHFRDTKCQTVAERRRRTEEDQQNLRTLRDGQSNLPKEGL